MKKYAVFFLLCILFACKQSSDNPIRKVTLGFSGVGSETVFPFEALSVDSDRNVYYFGGKYAQQQGYYKGRVSPELWDSIQTRFLKWSRNGLDSSDHNRSDHPSFECCITTTSDYRIFRENTGRLSTNDLYLLDWFSSKVLPQAQLVKTDSVAFETHIQYESAP